MSRRRKSLALLMRARMRPAPTAAGPSPAPAVAAASAAETLLDGGSPSLLGIAQFPPYHVGESHPSPSPRHRGGDGGSSETPVSVEAVKSLLRESVSSITGSSSASAEANLSAFLKTCQDLPSEGRQELLLELARDYDVDRARIRNLMQQYLSLGPISSGTGEVDEDSKSSGREDSSTASVSYRIERNLREALKPKYAAFILNINSQPGGLKLLLDLRADLLSLLKEKNCISLRALDTFLKEKLMTWLSPATLDLRHITWDSSASLLEKIVAYEAVHPIRNLVDLKKRLGVGRRCFGYLHPAIPGEPLIFIEVALSKHISHSIEEVLWETPPIPESEATCALFYSISSTQPGLTGVNLGRFLIKRVIQLVRREMPHVLTFATISPVPGFIQWLLSKLDYGRKLSELTSTVMQEDVPSSNFAENILQPEEEQQIVGACRGSMVGSNGMELLHNLLISRTNDWIKNDDLMAILQPLLMHLCARYLLKEKKRGKALDVVANFHLQNGAMIERINWMADTSEKGLCQSAGIMVNYVYRLDRIEDYAESYSRTGNIQASGDLIPTCQASLRL